jgi:Co/Zn/Cd efflux system component
VAELLQIRKAVPAGPAVAERARLEHRARMLAWGGIAWHFVEFGIAIAAGIAAGSIALIGFGADSLIETLSAHILVHPGDDCHAIRRELEEMLDQQFGITHITLQIDHSESKKLLTISGSPS